ncbi:MAG: hypothetical protein FWC10_00265 [Lentimicrobiaceae bacterium]|nr:hypothetical protein [Lentimicrobiaceae bacterium]
MKNKLKVIPLLLSAFCLLLSAVNAQIEKKELTLTPEMEEMLIAKIKNLPEEDYSKYGIKNRSQLENLQLGKAIPRYSIQSEKLDPLCTRNVFRLSEGDTFSVRFSNNWSVPVLCDETPLLFGVTFFLRFGGVPDMFILDINRMEQLTNYEHKDSIIGSVRLSPPFEGMDHLIIRKENQDIFVQIYDEVTGEYFKNEYRLNELISHIKELALREKEARMRYYEKVAHKIDLKLTPEITEMLINGAYLRYIDESDVNLSNWGIKDRSKLEHLELGKPIPRYRIEDQILIFEGSWEVPVMSGGELLYFATVDLKDDDQYRWACDGGGEMAEMIHNYEYKDLIIGFLWTKLYPVMNYLIIRKDNQDIFVKMYDRETDEYLKNEYSFNEVLNLLKK